MSRMNSFTNKSIYVVDDSDLVLVEVKNVLGEYFHVRTFDSAEKLVALAMKLSSPPDMILMDVEMPGMHGAEAVSRIREISSWKDAPIMLLTAWNSDILLEHFFSIGILDVIHKPIIKSVLLLRVENYLRLTEFIKREKARK